MYNFQRQQVRARLQTDNEANNTKDVYTISKDTGSSLSAITNTSVANEMAERLNVILNQTTENTTPERHSIFINGSTNKAFIPDTINESNLKNNLTHL